MAHDLNESHRSEEEFRDSERMFRVLIDGIQDYAIFRLDVNGVVTSWNQGAQRIKGYAADEIVGRHFSVFYPPEPVQRGWPEEELRRAQTYGRMEDEGWRVRKDGSYFWAKVVITAMRDETGKLLGFSKVTQDRTEQRKYVQELQESEENLRLVIEGARDHAMFLVSSDGQVQSWNAAAERVLGYAADQIIGQSIHVLYADEDRIADRASQHMKLAAEAGTHKTEGWRMAASGRKFWSNMTLNALFHGDGRLRGYVQIIQDLTDRMRVETLENEGRRIHTFIAMLSHELRNPLAPIVNAVQLLKQNPTDINRVDWCADLIDRQANHLRRLVDDLLDISRIDNGKIQIEPVALELNTLVKLACDAARLGIEQAGIALDVTLCAQSIFVEGDSTRLSQVLSNLLSNSAKFTPEGGRIEVGVDRDGSFTTVTVSDTGIGMSEELLQTAFEPFVQGAQSIDRSVGGLGIGLTLVKSIVELHGGAIWATSAGPNRGAQFTLRLPVVSGMAHEVSSHPTSLRVGQVRSIQILVVDDNQDAGNSLAELLRFGGYEVVIAYGSLQALELVRKRCPQVAFLDLGLPGMDGLELARRIRSQPGCRDVQLVAVSGYEQDTLRAQTVEAGFRAHLVKPVDFAHVLRILDQCLGSQQQAGSKS